MHVTIAARHLDMTDSIRTHVESRLDKLRHHFDRVIDVDVVLSVEKHRHTAEVTVHANGIRMHGADTSPDMYASVDTAVNKLNKQILKFKDKAHRSQIKAAKIADVAPDAIEVLIEDEPGPSVPAHLAVVHEPNAMKPMSVEEAAMQLQLTNDFFRVFRNEKTQEVNVVYVKHDGTIGHIDPE